MKDVLIPSAARRLSQTFPFLMKYSRAPKGERPGTRAFSSYFYSIYIYTVFFLDVDVVVVFAYKKLLAAIVYVANVALYKSERAVGANLVGDTRHT